ncbi:MAG: DNA-binding response regulator [Alphaproteobacteria bacterium]|nr:DNA-binding response regulator [Alphaproteobacteria bacterium]
MAVARTAPSARILEAATTAETLALVRSEPEISLVLLDLMMPDSKGFAGLAALHLERPNLPVLVVSAAEAAEAAARSRDYGAIGFLNKGAGLDEISAVIARALSGVRSLDGWAEAPADPEVDAMARRIRTLTPAQLKVLLGLLEGRLNKQIAFDMSISEATVKAHMTAVFRKLNVRNRTQAVLAARALALEPATV